IANTQRKLKKSYIDEKYGPEEAEKKYAEWDKLMQQLFVRRKYDKYSARRKNPLRFAQVDCNRFNKCCAKRKWRSGRTLCRSGRIAQHRQVCSNFIEDQRIVDSGWNLIIDPVSNF